MRLNQSSLTPLIQTPLIRVANTESKNALLLERDRTALDEASSLGLTRQHLPILATPFGDGLTRQEERWNDREKKAVQKIEERNRKTLSEFRNGEKLRQWELGNQNEDLGTVYLNPV